MVSFHGHPGERHSEEIVKKASYDATTNLGQVKINMHTRMHMYAHKHTSHMYARTQTHITWMARTQTHITQTHIT